MNVNTFFITVSSVILLSSCTLPPVLVVDHASRVNDIAWDVHNQMLLKNILHGRDRETMVFTSLNQVRGSLKYSASTGGIAFPFGGGTADEDKNAYVGNPVLSIESNPTFDISILDNQDFYRGIQKPITIDQIEHYISLGWPRHLLFYLVIERIEDGDDVYKNDPDDPVAFDRFRDEMDRWIRDPSRGGARITSAEEVKVVVERIEGEALNEFDILKALEAGYKLEKLEGSRSTAFRLLKPPPKVFAVGLDGRGTQIFSAFESPSANRVVYLRSPQAIMYYLGEIVRQPQPVVVTGRACDAEPLFTVSCERSELRDSTLTVRHRGSQCGIPPVAVEGVCLAGGGRSHQVLSLVSQLVGQSKSAKNLPSTGAVQVVN